MAVEQPSTEQLDQPTGAPPQLRPAGPASGLRKWLSIGTGAGIEIAGADLRVAVVRVRPGGVEVTAHTVIERFEERSALEWGAEYLNFARRTEAAASLPVTVVLPRREIVVRHLHLPGVEPKDMGSAVSWQADSLHAYADEPVVHGWARLGDTDQVIVGICRREIVDRYANLFAEAGIKLAGFTFSAAALYSGSRLLAVPPTAFLAVHSDGPLLEAYGESPARPIFSTWFDDVPEGVEPRAFGELRADGELLTGGFADLFAEPRRTPEGFDRERFALAHAAALANACPRQALGETANLLPEERRSQSARWIYIPTVILAALLVIAGLLLAWQPGYQEREYLKRLDAEIRKLEPRAQQAAKLDQAAQDARDRIELLDRFRRRSIADADALRELTNLLPATGWIQSLQMARTEVQLSGETDQAAALIKVLDGSPVFKDSTFSNSMTRSGSSEGFVIRSQREGPGTGEEPAPKQADGTTAVAR